MVEMRRTLFLRDLRPCSLNLLGGELVPRYFFHLRCEDSTVPDPTGADLRDPDHAFEAARSMACNLMSTQSDAGVNWLACFFEVRDEADTTVLEFPFAEAVEIKEQPN